MLSYYLFIAFLSITAPPDTLRLPETVVTAPRHHWPDSVRAFRMTVHRPGALAAASRSVGDVLETESGLILRAYGPGQLQTAGFRGFGAHQTRVEWEGMDLNHGMVGLTDLSLYPAFLMGRLETAAGSDAAVGGTIRLMAPTGARPEAVFSAGSFAERTAGLRSGWRAGAWNGTVAAVAARSGGGFPYRDVYRFPVATRRRVNADSRSVAAAFTAAGAVGRLGMRHAVLLTRADAGIPGPISGGDSRARQADATYRWLMELTGGAWSLRPSWAHHDLTYEDPDIGLVSGSQVTRWAVEGTRAAEWGRLSAGLDRTSVSATEYERDVPGRSHAHIRLDARYPIARFQHLTGSLQTDFDSDWGAYWSGALGWNRTRAAQTWRLQLARGVGLPTFNDLYWPDLGRADLVPETVHKAEAGWEGRRWGWDLGATLHAADIRNGIRWMPSAADPRFRPRNVQAMRTAGADAQVKTDYTMGRAVVGLESGLSWLHTRYLRARFPGDAAVGKAVAYAPELQWHVRTQAGWLGHGIGLTARYIGTRAVAEDGSSDLPAVLLWDLHLTLAGHLRWEVRNAGNARYERISGYPMPGIHHQITLHLHLP